MGASFQVRLLGGFSVQSGDAPLTGISTARLRSLLAYLILNCGRPQARQHVAFRLWPDAPESHARSNLRQFLYQLRRALPDSERFLVADNNTICWRRDDGQVVDVWLFQRALEEADAAESARDPVALRRALESSLECYQGDLLPECYDEWIADTRDDLRRRHRRACQRLIQVLESGRDYGSALPVAEVLLRLDPLDEETYALLMRLHAQNGDRAAVRRVYRAAVETIGRELGTAPDEALRREYLRLQQPSQVPVRSAREDGGAGHAPGLVGRLAEWKQLQVGWSRASGGWAHLTLISGEAGIGKSRLAEELFTWVQAQGLTTAYTRSYGAEGNLSLAPVTEWLHSPSLRPFLATLDPVWLTEIARLLPELLAEYPDVAAPEPIGESGRRRRFFEGLARAVLAVPPPCLLWIDDLQWCDCETLEWFHFLLRFAGRSPLLILGTARDDGLPRDHPLSSLIRQLRSEDRLGLIELAPLDAAETARLAAQISGRALDETAAVQMYRETEGNPLFVVETVRAGLSDFPGSGRQVMGVPATMGHTGAPALTLPPRVYDVIAGRLASLSPRAHQLAAVGAAIGRAFKLDVLLKVASETEDEAIRALDELWQKRIVRERSPGVFDFTHDKLREVALAEISPPQRRLWHRCIAQTLETLNAETLDVVSAQIALQYEQSGQLEQAVPYYKRAARVSASVYANQDAIALTTHALSLLTQLPPGPGRDGQELALQLLLAPLYRITKGWASPEEERVMNRAVLLSTKVGDVSQREQALYGLQSVQVVAAQLEKVEHTYAEMYRLFMQTQGEPPPPFAALMYAGAALHMGRLVEACEQFERIVSVRDPRHVKDLQDSQGVNYLSHGHAWNAHALWCLGYPRRALESAMAGLEIAREYTQPFNQALAVTFLAMLQELSAEPPVFQRQAEEAVRLTREYEAPYYLAWSSILLQFARTWSSPGQANLEALREAIDRFRAAGARLRLPYYFSLLARAHAQLGEFEQGLAVIEGALVESLQNHERWWDPELHRLRGELMFGQGTAAPEVEAAFQRALETSRAEGAKSLELRAATSLARLWRSQGRSAAARDLLAPVCGWFSADLDTPDLRAALAALA